MNIEEKRCTCKCCSGPCRCNSCSEIGNLRKQNENLKKVADAAMKFISVGQRIQNGEFEPSIIQAYLDKLRKSVESIPREKQ